MLDDIWQQIDASQTPGGKDMARILVTLRERLGEYADRNADQMSRLKELEQTVDAQGQANNRMRASIEEILTLQELAVAIRSARDIKTITDTLFTQLSRIVEYSLGDLFLFDEQNQNPTSLIGVSEQLTEVARFHLQEGIMDWILSNGKPAMIPRMDANSEYDFLVVPLIVRDRGIGAVMLALPLDQEVSEHDLSLINLLTDQAAVAIEKSRVYEELIEVQGMLESSYSHIMRSERLAAVEELAAGVAHEINNPLQVISSSLELIIMQDGIPADSMQFIEMIERETGRISTIVSDLLDFARKDKSGTQIHPIDLNETIRRSLVLVRHQYKYVDIEVTLDFHEAMPPVYVYDKELQQAFINVLTHNRRVMNDGGKLEITTQPGPVWNIIRFEDTGEGVSEKIIEQIFHGSPFHSVKSGEADSGLALAMSYNLIKKYRGIMSIENKDVGGTVITIKLPIKAPADLEETYEDPVTST